MLLLSTLFTTQLRMFISRISGWNLGTVTPNPGGTGAVITLHGCIMSVGLNSCGWMLMLQNPLGTSVSVHDFSQQYPKCTYIKCDEEGDCSSDSRYWAFEVRDSAWKILSIVTYDKKTEPDPWKDDQFPV